MLTTILLIISACWVASEVGLVVLRRSAPDAKRKDSGSLLILNVVIYTSVSVGMYLGATGQGRLAIPVAVIWLALFGIVVGIALRWWAVLSLRRFFTVDVAIHPDHRLVQAGPYRVVRHPAYSGSLLSFGGLAVCGCSWLSILVILAPITVAFLYRIHVEERALLLAFPSEYREYSARTSRLIPGLY